jgi:CHASE2 domain-containing sensor protein
MKTQPRRLVLVSGLVPALIVSFLSIVRPAFFDKLDSASYDALLRGARTRPPSGDVVIVDVDERSLSSVGQWPWRRDLVGNLVTKIRDLGASAIALDIVFAESDRYSGSGAVTDEAMADALRPGGVVVGYALTFDRTPRTSSACVQHPLGLVLVRRDDERAPEPFFQASGVVCSLPVLTQAAGASGFLNAAPDPDGLLRRVPLLAAFNGHVYPALGLAAVIAARNIHDVTLRMSNVNSGTLWFGSQNVPLDGKSNMRLRYRGARGTFRYVSAADVLAGDVAAGAFKNKIIFVGTTALGTREVVSTPIDTLFAGVEVQATVADNLLQQDYIRRPDYSVPVETLGVLAVGVVASLLVAQFGLAWGGATVAAYLAAVWAGSIALMAGTSVYLSPLYPTVGLISSLGAIAGGRFAHERHRAEQAGHDKVISQRLMVQTLLSLTEVRDIETGRHSRRTREYARVLAMQLASHPDYRSYLTSERIELLASLAPLHDIGKVGVPDRLLNKAGMLTEEETAEMRKHPAHGRDVIVHAERDAGSSDDAILALAKEIVYTHHEKWDGSGYPQGLKGAAIPIAGRLMALVDVYDAVTTRRAYREPMSHDEAVKFIVSGRGSHFDPTVVDAFLEVSRTLRHLSPAGE